MDKQFSRVELARMLATTDLTMKQLGEHFGVSYEAVRKAATQGLGVDLAARRKKHGRKKAPPPRVLNADRLVEDLLTSRLSMKALAEKHEVALSTVYAYAKRENVDLKARLVDRSTLRH